MKETTLYIEGLDCEDEARIIRGALKGLKGISSFEINVMTGTLNASFDEKVLKEQDLLRAISSTGMKARKKKVKEEKGPWWKEPKIVTLSACGLIILATLILEHIFRVSHAKATFLYAAATLVGGYYPARMGIAALKTLRPNIRTLMVVGAAGAAALGLWEESALLVLIYSLGDVLEAYAADRVRGAVRALMEIAPKEALVRRNGKEVVISADDVVVGDVVIIRPGEKVPLDGKILKGTTSVDQSPITGESMPVQKGPGMEVYAGSINQRGAVEVAVTRPFEDSTLGRIIHYVEKAEAKRSSYQRFGETFGLYYTPLMFTLALLVIIVPSILYGGFSGWFYRGLVVLVVSCSCGIALSIPVSVVAAVANAARHGVLIKGGAYLEAASKIKAIAFDKTGSLTVGRPVVTDIIPFRGGDEEGVLKLAASIESRSEHVLAEAILRSAREKGLELYELNEFEAVTGMGARAVISGKNYCIGSMALCDKLDDEEREKIKTLESEGKTVIVLAGEEGLKGVIAVRDELRPEAGEAVRKLKGEGIQSVIMLTGDNRQVAAAVARDAGIDRFMAELLPEEKVDAVKGIQKEYGHVAMVGDGVNDAPAMVSSEVGIAMGAAGTDVAIETGDVVLMSDDLLKIPYVIGLSKRAVRNIRQNITLSLIVIAFLVPMALFGRIGLVPGLLVNEIGGIIVILNGLRLLR
ncbi:MAG: heavy metal translocating P-type ATPase [Thermodesulfobacteriota bacterium]|nr:MAG: heavy metal translocating P-type ATPase [Thermodesulfobacteriota bacterium]